MTSIVDTHIHVIAKKGDPKYPRDERFAIPWVHTHAIDMDELLALFDRVGVQKAPLVQALTGHAYDNSYTIDSCKRFPKRFTPIAMVDPVAPDVAATLTTLIEKDGIRGCRINSRLATPDDPRTAPMWETLGKLNTPLLIMPGGQRVPLEAVGAMAARYPDVTVILDHIGAARIDPEFKQAQPLFDLAKSPKFFVKFSTNMNMKCFENKVRPYDFLKRLVDAYGVERVMWGSNYPALHEPEWTYERHLEVARDAVSGFSKKDQDMLMGGSAMLMWPEIKD